MAQLVRYPLTWWFPPCRITLLYGALRAPATGL